jgi:hypothetical protein
MGRIGNKRIPAAAASHSNDASESVANQGETMRYRARRHTSIVLAILFAGVVPALSLAAAEPPRQFAERGGAWMEGHKGFEEPPSTPSSLFPLQEPVIRGDRP